VFLAFTQSSTNFQSGSLRGLSQASKTMALHLTVKIGNLARGKR